VSGLTDVLGKVASYHSGHETIVRFRNPARTDALAIAFKHRSGVGVIDLRKSHKWDDASLWWCCLHESYHIADLWDEWRGIDDLASDSISPPRWVHDLPGIKQIESDADKYADKLFRWAQENHMKYIQPGLENDCFSLYARALLDYQK